MFQYKAKEIEGSVLERGKIMENLKKRVEKLEDELVEQYKINIKIRQEQRFLNVMLIIAFLNILVITVTK